LYFVSKDGQRAAVHLGERVDPFNRATELGRQVWHSGLAGISWDYLGENLVFKPRSFDFAYPTHDMQGIAVIFRGDKEYGYPDNAIILNADGTVRCRIQAPVRPLSGMASSIMRIDQAFWARRGSGEPFTAIAVTLGKRRISGGEIKPWVSDFYEERELDVMTGKCIGELLGSGRW
jgi:hypothetical protein